VRLDDLACQRQPEAGAATFGRIKRQQRLCQHGVVHAGPGIGHFEPLLERMAGHRQRHRVGVAARLGGVLQQVDQGLFDLRGVEVAGRRGQRAGETEAALRRQAFDERRPGHGARLRCRQLGEARIGIKEAVQVACTLADDGEDAGQAFDVAAPRQFGAAVRERRDRRQRVVQLVADDADHALPGRHLLARQFTRHAAEQLQPVRPALQPESALRPVEGFFAAVERGAEESVVACRHRLAQRRRRLLQQQCEVRAFEAAPLAQQMARRDVGVDHTFAGVDQQQRHRRVLHHGVEQQFTLFEVLALFAQGMAQGVVLGHEVAELVVGTGGQRGAEVAVAITQHRAFERANEAAQRRQQPRRSPERGGQQQRGAGQRPPRGRSRRRGVHSQPGPEQRTGRGRRQQCRGHAQTQGVQAHGQGAPPMP